MPLRESWAEFSKPPVGQRFTTHYHNRDGGKLVWFKKPFFILTGCLMIAAGLLMLIAPGPGLVALALGAALLAQESLWIAKFMDGCDLHGRRLVLFLWRNWQAAPLWLKGLIILVCLTLAGLAAWLAWWVWQEYYA